MTRIKIGIMHGILSWACIRTTSSLNIRRCKCVNLQQKYRNLGLTSLDLLQHSSISKSKNDDANQIDVRQANDIMDNKVIDNSKPRSHGTWSQYATHKYERFAENSSRIIYDFDEEQKRLEDGIETEEEVEEAEVVLKRGVTGVFDVEELVDLLREENAKNIVAIKVPKEMKYVDYMVIVTSNAQRHINALSQLVRRVYKKKKMARDQFCVLEGKNTDWVAMDMGNIALHIMTANMRESYDLETLWTVGAQFDEKCQEEDNQNPMDLYNLTVKPLQDFSVSQLPAETTLNVSQLNIEK